MTETISYNDELTGRDFDIEVELNFYKEKYGEDADGNRGEWRSYCEVEYWIASEEIRTMPLWLFKIVHFFNKKVRAWKTVEYGEGELPTELESRIDCYVQDYDFSEVECTDYYDKDDDGDRRYDEMRDNEFDY